MNEVILKIKSHLVFALCAAFLAFSSPAFADPASFAKALDAILDNSCLKKKRYGIEIYSLDREEILYETRKDELFIPASNLKLITTAVALKHLGPDYRFPTRVYTTGRLDGDTLFGDLYIKGYGDPKFVTEQMWLLVNELENLPIRKIVGNILADATYFDPVPRVKTWSTVSGPEAYNAPLGALSFNFNTVTVYVSAGKTPGQKPLVILEPETDYVKLGNHAETLPPKKRGRLVVNRVNRGSYDEVIVRGGIRPNLARSKYYVNISDPTVYTVNVFREYLTRAGIEVVGDIGQAPVPANARMLLKHESEPLSLALRGLNKFSNNFVAEQILKTMGAKRFGAPGTTENGIRIIGEYMEELGYAPEEYTILDGSGLSRDSRLSPQQIIKVLDNVRKDLGVYPEFISALGVMGVDGNVKKRMNGVKGSQKARVKTGTLNGVSALSGYFQSRDGEKFAFSILMNDLKCGNGRVLRLQDRILREGLNFVRGDDREKKAVPAGS